MATKLEATFQSSGKAANLVETKDSVQIVFSSPPDTATDVKVELFETTLTDPLHLATFRGSIQGGKFTLDAETSAAPNPELDSKILKTAHPPKLKVRFDAKGPDKEVPLPDFQVSGPVFKVKLRVGGSVGNESRSFEGDSILNVRVAAPPVISGPYPLRQPNEVHFYANGAKNNVGSAKDGYFKDLKEAIAQARHFIFIADWSFQPMMVLERVLPSGQAEFKNKDTIGFALAEKAKLEDFLVAIHTWNHTNKATPDGPNDDGAKWFERVLGGKRPDRLLWRASSRTTIGMSHHQKFVLLDAPVDPKNADDPQRHLKAFIGGLDLTKGRIDWSDHANLPGDKEAAPFLVQTKIDFDSKSALFNEWYNAEFFSIEADHKDTLKPDLPRQTWHDIHCVVIGPTAWDVMREFVGRWNRTAGFPVLGDDKDKHIELVLEKHDTISKDPNFHKVDAPVENANTRWNARILRSQEEDHWGDPSKVKVPASVKGQFDWKIPEVGGKKMDRSIQDVYLDTIKRAERFVYIETQYLIGSGSKWRNARGTVANGIPEAIVERTKTMIKRGRPFHTYIVMPMFPEGDPVSPAAKWQRLFEFETMRFMAVSIHTEARKNSLSWFHFLTFLYPVRWAHLAATPQATGNRQDRVRANRRYMIYVHSKLMIVDDRFVIIGSANLNERSLAGDRDSEICVLLEPAKGKESAAVGQVTFFRKQLFRELLAPRPIPSGFTDDPAWDKPETADCIKAVHGTAFRNYLYFRRGLTKVIFTAPDGSTEDFVPDGFLCTFPFDMVTKGLPSSKGDFDILDTNKLKTANMQAGVLSITSIRELDEILKRKCPEGDAFLPDSASAANEWKWESEQGFPGFDGIAE